MRTLLLGASGMLGRDLAAAAPDAIQLHVCSRHEIDVRDAPMLAATLDRLAPDLVVNATGYTAVDRAESEREQAFAINANAVGTLAEKCATRGIILVHFSTDYVFDGSSPRPYRENDPANPLNAYGESKLAGEEALLSSGAPALLLRTQWLFGLDGRCFPRAMAERALRRELTRVVNDQRGRPTSTSDLARATWELVMRRELGIFHVSNGGEEASWFEVARQVFAHYGVPELVVPCTTTEFRQIARRPAYSALDNGRVERTLGQPLRDWRVALGEFLTLLPEARAAVSS